MENNSYKGKTRPKTPPIEKCFCGETPYMLTWDFGQTTMGHLQCKNGHRFTRYCFYHRAVCLWNNRVKLKKIEIERSSNVQ
jgi:hypothetical protein